MGTLDSAETLFENLNKNFGGSEYYGIHAGPFVDLFAKYRLTARPVNDLSSIKYALSLGHLVMAWINVGQGKAVDVDLAYGKTPVVKGEHNVVITGYDLSGFWIMDPGRGVMRKISSANLRDASRLFSIPFLEVYPASARKNYSYDLFSAPVDKASGLDRSIIKISVKNGSAQAGTAGLATEILKDFGYKVISIGNADSKKYDGITVKIREKYKDYISIIQKDLSLAFRMPVKISVDSSSFSSEDAVVIIGV